MEKSVTDDELLRWLVRSSARLKTEAMMLYGRLEDVEGSEAWAKWCKWHGQVEDEAVRRGLLPKVVVKPGTRVGKASGAF